MSYMNVIVGVNDTRFVTVTHMGTILNVGDTVMGYDLSTAVINDLDMKPLEQADISLPDVVLVRKKFLRRVQKRSRNWKLKNIEGVESAVPLRKAEQTKEEQDYQQFLDELEEDKEMRSKINLYKGIDNILISKYFMYLTCCINQSLKMIKKMKMKMPWTQMNKMIPQYLLMNYWMI